MVLPGDDRGVREVRGKSIVGAWDGPSAGNFSADFPAVAKLTYHSRRRALKIWVT
ncbi:hypothetical protein GCM10022232_07510 [Streptomyces plumbiresistens]|uniref:Uncharacterized protein n=1 Tax=Streptomyces plumbiresistens TaxID=511811 RepID=A0ABP7Q866_9ACTN